MAYVDRYVTNCLDISHTLVDNWLEHRWKGSNAAKHESSTDPSSHIHGTVNQNIGYGQHQIRVTGSTRNIANAEHSAVIVSHRVSVT